MTTTFSLVPIPRWYFAENNGTPLYGSMATWLDSDPTVPKPIFSDSGGVNAWPNPVNFLSNGEAPGMFFWADDHPYFIQVYDKPNGTTDPTAQIVFTVRGFGPGIAGGGGGGSVTNTNAFLENYITNNVFYRNAGTLSNPANGTVLAPSNHEGFRQTDILYLKTGAGSTETISFPTSAGDFAAGFNPLSPSDVTPETYIDWHCTAAGAETAKAVQFPVDLHVKNFETQTMTFIVWAKAPSGTPNLTASFVQDFGTGPAVSAQVVTTIAINASPLSNSWVSYTGQVTIPSTSGKTLSGGADDASYIQLGLPLTTGEIYFTKPKLYLNPSPSTAVGIFPELPSYDYVDRITNSVRTGDIRTTMNSVAPGGWVGMNDGTIGDASSGSSTRANSDTWQLFNMLWSGTTNVDCPVFTSAGVLSTRGADAITDFNAHKQIALPKGLGRVFAGANPSAIGVTKFITASNSAGDLLLTVDDTSPFYTGTQVTFTNSGGALPGNLVAATQYWLTVVSSTTFKVSVSLSDALLATPVYVAFLNAGSGTNSFTTTLTAHALGSFRGEDTEALTISEMPNHTHTVWGDNGNSGTAVGPTANKFVNQNADKTSDATGGSVAHNILQPTTYMNVFIKL